jgi:hypothetical protein
VSNGGTTRALRDGVRSARGLRTGRARGVADGAFWGPHGCAVLVDGHWKVGRATRHGKRGESLITDGYRAFHTLRSYVCTRAEVRSPGASLGAIAKFHITAMNQNGSSDPIQIQIEKVHLPPLTIALV